MNRRPLDIPKSIYNPPETEQRDYAAMLLAECEFDGSHVYAINTEFGERALVVADNESDALDTAVDKGALDADVMSHEDHAEYDSNGWHDSFVYAGNAGEPIWCEYMTITRIL